MKLASVVYMYYNLLLKYTVVGYQYRQWVTNTWGGTVVTHLKRPIECND